ncbi:hypothetical protein ABPG72_011266 [Tetrahymena utriculariae]
MSLNHIDINFSPLKQNKYYLRQNGSLANLRTNIQSTAILKKQQGKDISILSSAQDVSLNKLNQNPSSTSIRSIPQNPHSFLVADAPSNPNLSNQSKSSTKFRFPSEIEINMEQLNSDTIHKKSYADMVRKQPKEKITKAVQDFERYMMTPISGTPKCYGDFESGSKLKNTLQALKLPPLVNHSQKIEATVDNINDELQKYKYLNKIVEVNGFYDKSHDLKVSMLSFTMRSPHTLPRSLGINKSLINDKRKINISSQFIGDKYSEMASEALKHEDLEKVESVKLKDNNLTSSSLSKIVQSLPRNIQKLNLAENTKLGKEGILHLAPALQQKKYIYLSDVNLENTNLQDEGAQLIIQSLINSTNVQVLNLSRNSITDAVTPVLKQFLEASDSLSELYMHWNKLTSIAGCQIADALKLNNNLMVLDLSFNGLGSHFGLNSKMCGKSLIESLNRQKSNMRHLDISYNNFTVEEGRIIQEAIKGNDGIIGFHFEGNCNDMFYVDSRGFLIERKLGEEIKEQLHLKKKRIQGVKFLGQNKIQNDLMNVVDNCWICDGWTELQFSVEGVGDCTFLHFDFEGYRPICMDKQSDGKFILIKMCPPLKKIRFFFTDPTSLVAFTTESYQKEKQLSIHNNAVAFKHFQQTLEGSLGEIPTIEDENQQELKKQKGLNNSGSQKKIPTSTSISNNERSTSKSRFGQSSQKKIQQKDTKPKNDNKKEFSETMKQLVYNEKTGKYTITYQDGTPVDYEMPIYFNVHKTDTNKSVFSKYKDVQILSYPRVPEKIVQLSAKSEWVVEKSIFKDFLKDTEDLIDKCFEFDFNQSRIAKLITDKDDLARVKSILKENYRKIKRNYKLYSSYASGEIFCIAQNILSQFAIKCGIIDNKFSFADLDYNIIATSSVQKINNYLNPDKVLIRYKFMEIFVRIAGDKYIKYGKCKKYAEALTELFSDSVLQGQLALADDAQEWRYTKFWNEGCDIIFKQNMDLIKSLWNQFADSRKTEKRSFMNYKTMNISEFRDFINYFQFIDISFNERDINMVFNMSMQTCIDEVNNDKHLLMNFNEFLESIARIAEIRVFKEEEKEEANTQSEEEQENNNEGENEKDDDQISEEGDNNEDFENSNNNQSEKESSRYNSKQNSFEQPQQQLPSSLAYIQDNTSENEEFDEKEQEQPKQGKSVMFFKQKTIDIDQVKKSMAKINQANSSSGQNTPSKRRDSKNKSQNSFRGSQIDLENEKNNDDEETQTKTKTKIRFKDSQVELNSKPNNIDIDFQRRQERNLIKQAPLKLKLFQLISYILKKQAEKAKKGDKKHQIYKKQQSLIDLKNSIISVERSKDGNGYVRRIEGNRLFQRATDKLQIDDQQTKK